jgi:hypothetical protein
MENQENGINNLLNINNISEIKDSSPVIVTSKIENSLKLKIKNPFMEEFD